MRCDLCDQEASVSVTSYVVGSETCERYHYCASHGGGSGLLIRRETADFGQRTVDRLRALAHFIKLNGRAPTGQERDGNIYPGEIEHLLSQSTTSMAELLAVLEFWADFIEKNGRYPRPNESSPDDFHILPV
jgi:hypothetical protein